MTDFLIWFYIVSALFLLVLFVVYVILYAYECFYVKDSKTTVLNKNNKYLIREDSAHTGKQSVIVTNLNDKTIKKYLTSALQIRFDFGDEIVYYDIIESNEMFTTAFMDEWNLFNSLYLENSYKNLLDKQYYKRNKQ